MKIVTAAKKAKEIEGWDINNNSINFLSRELKKRGIKNAKTKVIDLTRTKNDKSRFDRIFEKNPGGVCLYRGCIPSKALLHVAKLINETHEAKDWGVEFSEPKINLEKLRDWKSSVVSKLTGGLGQLSKQRKINYLQGKASFINSSTLKIEKQNGTEVGRKLRMQLPPTPRDDE